MKPPRKCTSPGCGPGEGRSGVTKGKWGGEEAWKGFGGHRSQAEQSIAWGLGFRQPGLGPQPFDEGPGPLHPLQRDSGRTAATVTTRHLCWGRTEVLSETDGEAWPLQPMTDVY